MHGLNHFFGFARQGLNHAILDFDVFTNDLDPTQGPRLRIKHLSRKFQGLAAAVPNKINIENGRLSGTRAVRSSRCLNHR